MIETKRSFVSEAGLFQNDLLYKSIVNSHIFSWANRISIELISVNLTDEKNVLALNSWEVNSLKSFSCGREQRTWMKPMEENSGSLFLISYCSTCLTRYHIYWKLVRKKKVIQDFNHVTANELQIIFVLVTYQMFWTFFQ